MSNFTCQSKSFISIFFICQVSACELRPFSCYNLANDIHSQTAKTVFSHLKQLKLKMKGYGLAEQIKVDREDLILDLFQYYQDPDFNLELQIKIQFKREPAINNGGLLRQAYEMLSLHWQREMQG